MLGGTQTVEAVVRGGPEVQWLLTAAGHSRRAQQTRMVMDGPMVMS